MDGRQKGIKRMKSEQEVRTRLEAIYDELVRLRHQPKPWALQTRQDIDRAHGRIDALEWVLELGIYGAEAKR